MIIYDCEQGSAEWHTCRLGIPTASEFKSVLAQGEGKMRRTYMMKLLGERFTGEPAENFSNGHMERGKAMEAEARDLYAFRSDTDLRRVGFIRNEIAGCSPDGLVGEAGGVEIKTKLPHLQIDALFADRLPPEHMVQVQGHLWVTGREWWDFVSYWPRLPLFVRRVYRDGPFIRMLENEIQMFVAELDDLTRKLERQGATRLIGGVP